MMLRRLALAALIALAPSFASAQFATIGPTPATTDNGDRLATTAWVNNFFAAGAPLATGKIWIGSAGGLAAQQTPSGDCTLSVSGVITCTQSAGAFTVNGLLAVIGGELQTNIAAPATPAAGKTQVYVDSTNKVLSAKNDAGAISNTVVPSTAPANQWANGLNNQGAILYAQVNFSNLAGSLSCAQAPALTGDITTSAGTCATTLASVITAGGPTGSATVAPIITYDAKGRLTVVSSATITPAIGSITGLGTGVATALGTNVGSPGAFVTLTASGGLSVGTITDPGAGAILANTSITATTNLIANSSTNGVTISQAVISRNNSAGSLTIAAGTGAGNTFAMQTAGLTRMAVSDTGAQVTGAFTATTSIGYPTGIGAGGAVTQLTSRTTGVTLNKITGAITLFSAAGSTTATTFTVTNSAVAATDTVILNQASGTNLYEIFVTAVAAGSFNVTFLTTGGVVVDAPVFNFAIIKGSAN